MQFTHKDSFKFVTYTTLFFFLFFGYNTVSGPYFETTYDSASIENTEMPISNVFLEKNIDTTNTIPVKKNIQRKYVKKEPLTIAFNPDYIKIDNIVLDRLKEVINSSHFQSKVTPLNLVLDSERSEPRGQVTGNKLILSTAISNNSEQLKVFVHELGHIVDIFYLKK
jgi:hypothetical protein